MPVKATPSRSAPWRKPFSDAGGVPPWLGMYGFGEYARLGGRNAYHNYTTALGALYRRTSPVDH